MGKLHFFTMFFLITFVFCSGSLAFGEELSRVYDDKGEPIANGNRYSAASTTDQDSVSFYINGKTEFHSIHITYLSPEGEYEDERNFIDVVNSVEGGTQLSISNLDWSKSSTYYITMRTSNYLLYLTITEKDAGTVIPLSLASSGNVPIHIEGPSNDFVTENISVSLLDDEGRVIIGGFVDEGVYIPRGKYNIQVTGKDATHGYDLIKRGYVTTTDSNIVSFSSDELMEIAFDNSKMENIALEKFYTVYELGLTFSYKPLELNGINKIYVNENHIERLFAIFETQENFTFYSVSEKVDSSKDKTISFDTNFIGKVNFKQDSYGIGENLYFGDHNKVDIGFYDSYGNRLVNIFTYEGDELIGQIEFNNSSHNQKNGLSNFAFARINLPEMAGVYDVTLQFDSAPFQVISASGSITISENPGTNPVPSLDLDFNRDGYIDIFDIVKAAKDKPANLKRIFTID